MLVSTRDQMINATYKMNSEKRLETPKQLAAQVGLPVKRIYDLLNEGQLDYVLIGCRKHIPQGAWERFVQERTIKCLDVTKAPASSGSRNGSAGTSSGPTADAAASEALAREHASKLKTGEFSKPFFSASRGFVIVKLLGRKEARGYEAQAKRIREDAGARAYHIWRNSVSRAASVNRALLDKK